MKSMAIFGDILGFFFRFQSFLWVSTVFFGGLKIFYGFFIVFFTALKDLLWIFSFFNMNPTPSRVSFLGSHFFFFYFSW